MPPTVAPSLIWPRLSCPPLLCTVVPRATAAWRAALTCTGVSADGAWISQPIGTILSCSALTACSVITMFGTASPGRQLADLLDDRVQDASSGGAPGRRLRDVGAAGRREAARGRQSGPHGEHVGVRVDLARADSERLEQGRGRHVSGRRRSPGRAARQACRTGSAWAGPAQGTFTLTARSSWSGAGACHWAASVSASSLAPVSLAAGVTGTAGPGSGRCRGYTGQAGWPPCSGRRR